MAHGVVEEWTDNSSDKSPGPPSGSSGTSGASGRVMGSRRIFAPQFKLKVLDSYRHDAECKGNQRATARKYGIHRRQIQKWLQMESHLRSLTGGSTASGGPSSPGGVSSVSMSSPVPSPVPSPSHSVASLGSHSSNLLLANEPQHHAALNLSCEARLLGAVAAQACVRGMSQGVSAMAGANCVSPSVLSGSGSPLHESSPRGSPQGSPACSPGPHGPHGPNAQPQTQPQAVAVPRLSASPTLPIKKRWYLEQPPLASPPTPGHSLPLARLLSAVSDEEEDDDEDIDVDGDGTESEASSALDYTTATLSKRRSFSLQFKLEVLDAFREDPHCQGNQRATARRFGINRRQVQKWLGQEPDLREEAVSRGGLNRQRLGRWMDQEETSTATASATAHSVDTGCLDLRKRKMDPSGTSDVEDAESEAKRARVTDIAPAAPTADAYRPSSHPLLFRPQPVNFPLMLPLPLSPALLPFDVCAKQYSLDLNLKPTTFDYFTAHQQNLQKWFKPQDFLKHNNASFLLNSLR